MAIKLVYNNNDSNIVIRGGEADASGEQADRTTAEKGETIANPVGKGCRGVPMCGVCVGSRAGDPEGKVVKTTCEGFGVSNY